MNNKTRKLTTVGMLCALAYAAVAIGRIPIVLFLKYDPKDVIIVIGGLIFGPAVSFLVSLIVSFVEMFTISDTGIWGCIMNILSTCTFACTAALIYKKRRNLSGAIIGLLCGWAVAELLLPAFLPFNLIKGGLNAAFTMLLYKPVVKALRRSHLIEAAHETEQGRINLAVMLVSLLVLAAFILLALLLKGVI